VREYWEQLDWGSLSESFGDRTLQRGRDYAKYRHVRSLWVTEDGKSLLATVTGTHEYKTLVVLKDGHGKNQFVPFTNCSCPFGTNCKHGVATIIHFLDYLAQNKPIPLCQKLEDDNTIWNVVDENGKTKTIIIEPDYEYDDEDDDWDNEHDDWDEDDEKYDNDLQEALRTTRSSLPKPGSKNDIQTASLEEKLDRKSPKELVDLILHLFNEYDDVREHFEQEAFAESVAKTGSIAQLVEKAIKLIDKEISDGLATVRRYGNEPSIDFNSVTEIVKQFKKFDDALAAADRVAKHLLKKGGHYLEESGAEDSSDFGLVFDDMVEALLASKTSPISIILWAYDISHIDEYDLAGLAIRTILKRDWTVKIWSDVADTLLARMSESLDYSLRIIVETLDKASRQEEATDLLRAKAGDSREHAMLVERLINFGHLDEAEKICWEQRNIELKEGAHSGFYHDNSWSGRLKKIAEKKENYPMRASIEAAAFFEEPRHEMLLALLQTAKKIKIEQTVGCAIEAFLQTGVFPAAVQKELEGIKPTAKEQQDWQIPFYAFSVEKKEQRPRFDVLCEWAIAEQRPNDVVRWFDELAKQGVKGRTVSREKVADAISNAHPDRALRLYREMAEHEMEVSRDYPAAVRLLRKIRKTLEGWGRSADWQPLMAEVRATHRRKSSLMKQLDELEAGSIVNQKRHGK
jgi:uncharacterized Zn finger protein